MNDLEIAAEHRLLLLCAARHTGTDPVGQAETLLQSPVDWTRLVEDALAHGVSPLLCRLVHRVDPALVPSDVLTAAQTHLDDVASRNRDLSAALLEILDALDRAGIAALPFKGPVLAETYYGDPGLRTYRDLDFLVAKQDRQATTEILCGLGYMLTETVPGRAHPVALSPRQAAAVWHYAGEYLFLHAQADIAVEPHWAFLPPTFGLDIDHDAIMTRARHTHGQAMGPVNGYVMGRPVPVLGAEDSVLSLCLHGAKEYWARLQWIADLDRVLAHETALDWDSLLSTARRTGSARIVLVGLQLAHLTLGSVLPPVVRAAIDADPHAGELADARQRALFDPSALLCPNTKISPVWMRMLPGWRLKARYMYRTATTPRVAHFVSMPLPDVLFPLYPGYKLLHDYMALPLWRMVKPIIHRSPTHTKTDPERGPS